MYSSVVILYLKKQKKNIIGIFDVKKLIKYSANVVINIT